MLGLVRVSFNNRIVRKIYELGLILCSIDRYRLHVYIYKNLITLLVELCFAAYFQLTFVGLVTCFSNFKRHASGARAMAERRERFNWHFTCS